MIRVLNLAITPLNLVIIVLNLVTTMLLNLIMTTLLTPVHYTQMIYNVFQKICASSENVFWP